MKTLVHPSLPPHCLYSCCNFLPRLYKTGSLGLKRVSCEIHSIAGPFLKNFNPCCSEHYLAVIWFFRQVSRYVSHYLHRHGLGNICYVPNYQSHWFEVFLCEHHLTILQRKQKVWASLWVIKNYNTYIAILIFFADVGCSLRWMVVRMVMVLNYLYALLLFRSIFWQRDLLFGDDDARAISSLIRPLVRGFAVSFFLLLELWLGAGRVQMICHKSVGKLISRYRHCQ